MDKVMTVIPSRVLKIGIINDDLSPISQLLGIPLRASKITGDTKGNGNNPLTSFMMLITDLDDPNWGKVLAEWDGEIGDVMFVRDDGKELGRDIGEWAQFAMSWVYYIFRKARRSGTRKAKQRAIKLVTLENVKESEGTSPRQFSF
ncbi:Uu.00g009680.m01.CDS01 [Anthostomella pinea]|uniref:Uu.00g009680.m01.CDS01 n=1 Tax=Anthostomella pinea TaxID=933095 RepID=A0AAI8VXE3_9PEZI|nr:Uu.00g009680.m01.CDS01 [Anthostomella pinea]